MESFARRRRRRSTFSASDRLPATHGAGVTFVSIFLSFSIGLNVFTGPERVRSFSTAPALCVACLSLCSSEIDRHTLGVAAADEINHEGFLSSRVEGALCWPAPSLLVALLDALLLYYCHHRVVVVGHFFLFPPAVLFHRLFCLFYYLARVGNNTAMHSRRSSWARY